MELRRSFTVREMLRGFHDFAVQRGWVFEYLESYNGIGDYLSMIRPDLCLVGYEAWLALPQEFWSSWPAIGLNIEPKGAAFPAVLSDDAAVGSAAADYLLSKNFSTFTTVRVGGYSWADRRLSNFTRAIEAAGRKVADGLSLQHGSNVGPMMQLWLRSLPPGTAILAACDAWAELVLLHCRYIDLSVPDQVAVLGVDDDDLICDLCRPTLSSVRISWRRIGAEAARLAELRLQGAATPGAPLLVPPAGVVERRTTEYTAVNHPEVAKALRYIREQAHLGLSVKELVDELPANRRWLERTFQRVLGRSVKEEILRIRVERAKQLLVTTPLAMPEIARRCGFADGRRLSETFRKRAGTTPTQYRSEFSIAR